MTGTGSSLSSGSWNRNFSKLRPGTGTLKKFVLLEKFSLFSGSEQSKVSEIGTRKSNFFRISEILRAAGENFETGRTETEIGNSRPRRGLDLTQTYFRVIQLI